MPAEYVWTGESLVVMSPEELDDLYREIDNAAAHDGPLRASEAEIVRVRPDYL